MIHIKWFIQSDVQLLSYFQSACPLVIVPESDIDCWSLHCLFALSEKKSFCFPVFYNHHLRKLKKKNVLSIFMIVFYMYKCMRHCCYCSFDL